MIKFDMFADMKGMKRACGCIVLDTVALIGFMNALIRTGPPFLELSCPTILY